MNFSKEVEIEKVWKSYYGMERRKSYGYPKLISENGDQKNWSSVLNKTISQKKR